MFYLRGHNFREVERLMLSPRHGITAPGSSLMMTGVSSIIAYKEKRFSLVIRV